MDFDDVNDEEGPNLSPSQAERHPEPERAEEIASDRRADRDD